MKNMPLSISDVTKVAFLPGQGLDFLNAAPPFVAAFSTKSSVWNAAVRATNHFSLEVWLSTNSSSTLDGRIFTVASDASCGANVAMLQTLSDVMTRVTSVPMSSPQMGECDSERLYSVSPPILPPDGQKRQLVWTWDGQQSHMYVNGFDLFGAVPGTDVPSTLQWSDTQTLSFGTVVACTGPTTCAATQDPIQFNGVIYMAAVYSEVLTADQVNTMFALGSDTKLFFDGGTPAPTLPGPLPTVTTTTAAPTTAPGGTNTTNTTAPATQTTTTLGPNNTSTAPATGTQTAAPGPNPFNNPASNPFLPNQLGNLVTGVQAEMRMDAVLETFDVQQYVQNLALLFVMDVKRIEVTAVTRGSVVVDFTVFDTPSSQALAVIQPFVNQFNAGKLQPAATAVGIPTVLDFRIVAVNNPNNTAPFSIWWILIIVVSCVAFLILVALIIIMCCRVKKHKDYKREQELNSWKSETGVYSRSTSRFSRDD